jgi:predicted nucleic acid-binding protein
LSLSAAKISHEIKIPMADSIMLATARSRDAVLWTQDADFASIPDVKYIPK